MNTGPDSGKAEQPRTLHPYEVDWNVSLRRIDTLGDASQKERLRSVVAALREILGEKFLYRAFRLGFNPAHSFKFIAVWDKNIVLDLHALLEACKGFKNFEAVAHRIKRCKELGKIAEAFSLLRTAKLFSKGFEVHFEPPLKSINRIPDMRLLDMGSGETFFVEVAELEQSARSKRIGNQINSLLTRFLHNFFGVEVRGKLESELTDVEATEIQKDLERDLISKAQSDGLFLYSVPGKFKIIAYKSERREEAEKIATTHGFDLHGISGPPEPNDLFRLPGKIQKEQRQLPGNSDNLIVIWNEWMLVPVMLAQNPIAKVLTQLFERRQHIAGVILASVFPNDSFKINVNPDILQFTDENGMVYSLVLLFREGKDEIKERIRSAIMKSSVPSTTV